MVALKFDLEQPEEKAKPDVLVHNTHMPLFEYACRDCGHRFEYLTRANQSPSCPSCASVQLEKQLSVFAVSASASSPTPFRTSSRGPCGTCGDPRGPGSCSMN